MNYDLQRFLTAQNHAYLTALSEINNGLKQSHWMWFIFPQIAGLGKSETAQYYGISGLWEAQAYLEHPVLGSNLSKICDVLLQQKGKSAVEIFGILDAQKLRSSMTLFAQASQRSDSIFHEVLNKYFASSMDPLTLAALS